MRFAMKMFMYFIIFMVMFIACSYVEHYTFSAIITAAADYESTGAIDVNAKTNALISVYASVFKIIFALAFVGTGAAFLLALAFPQKFEEIDRRGFF